MWPVLVAGGRQPCDHLNDHPQEVDGVEDVQPQVQVCPAGQILLVAQAPSHNHFTGRLFNNLMAAVGIIFSL